MCEKFCSQCGKKMPAEGMYCSLCGAAQRDLADAQPLYGHPAAQTPASYTPDGMARRKKPVAWIIVLITTGLLLLCAVLFGVWRLWLDKPEATAYKGDQTARQTEVPAVAPSGTTDPLPSRPDTAVPSPVPTETQSTEPSPAETPPVAPEQIPAAQVIGNRETAGLTEEQAIIAFGPPVSREQYDSEAGVQTELRYPVFILTLPEFSGNPPVCTTIQVLANPCPISVFGLNINMSKEDVKAVMAAEGFIIQNEDAGGVEIDFYSESINQYVMVEFTNDTVMRYKAMKGD